MKLGRVGIWSGQLDSVPFSKTREALAELEELGYAAIWFPESRGREAMSHAALLLGATSRIVVASGIANIYARDAMAMANGQRALEEAYPGRLLLGIGVSHQPNVEQIRGHRYEKPIATMTAYLDAMDAAPYAGVKPTSEPTRALAALGPKMLELAARRTAGAHPYFVPPEHTAFARKVMGDGPLLAPEQAVVLERDPSKAREIARGHMVNYLRLVNYTNNLRRLGWSEDDLANGGSDKLVDAIVAWGDEAAIVDRVRAHLDAGADHVCVQVLHSELPVQQWRELAPALLKL